MNKNIDVAEEWVTRLNQLASNKTTHNDIETIKTHKKTLEWLISKAKLVEQMDKALEFYADERNYIFELDDPHVDVKESEIMKDFGERAKKARKHKK